MIDFSSKKFGIISLGCDKNRVDTEKLIAQIRAAGGTLTPDIEEAQIIVVNTCAFLNESRTEAIDTVIECAQHKDKCLEKLVVTGCLPQKFGNDVFAGLTEADVFLGTYDYDKFFPALERAYLGERVDCVGRGKGEECAQRVLTTPAHYAYLKIADGCNNRCTYCLIPSIRGAYRSFPIESLVAEAEKLGEISELIFVAQDVTRYGLDLYGKYRLADLLQSVTALENVKNVRLLYCYPDAISDELIDEIKSNPKIVKYIDIPLQHSEDGILKRMNRPGNRAEYLGLIEKLRKNIPDIAIRSTFIAGFPTESEADFCGLCDFLRQARLDNCGFFAYSREPGTPAYRIKGQIGEGVKDSRVKKLYEVQREISLSKLSARCGKILKVLCDGIDYEKNCFCGRAYFQAPDIDGKVFFKAPFAAQGEFSDVLIEKTDGYDLYGRTEDYIDE